MAYEWLVKKITHSVDSLRLTGGEAEKGVAGEGEGAGFPGR